MKQSEVPTCVGWEKSTKPAQQMGGGRCQVFSHPPTRPRPSTFLGSQSSRSVVCARLAVPFPSPQSDPTPTKLGLAVSLGGVRFEIELWRNACSAGAEKTGRVLACRDSLGL